MTEKTIIYEGRLEVNQADLINYLDNEVERVSIFDRARGVDYAPYPHLPIEIYPQKYGETVVTSDEIENIINPVIGQPDSGRIYMHKYWHENTQIIWGWNYVGFLGQFYIGQIKLEYPKLQKDRFTDVTVVSEWAAMRPYYEWIKMRLLMRFKERHKGGPKGIPLQQKIEYVTGWKKAEGKMLKEIYCANQGISISALRKWERELKEKNLLPKS